MDEKPKTPLKESWNGRHCLRDWLILVVATFLILLLVTLFIPDGSRNVAYWSQTSLVMLVASLVIATIPIGLFGGWYFIGWLRNWHNLRRFLFGLACVATLIALFYAEEDWRGKHDWEKYQREGEAKGEQFSWQSIVPAPVPDDENFAFSPVWIAEEKFNFLNSPKEAEAWYGNRIYNDDVSKLLSLMPVSVSGLVGKNWWANPPKNL